MPIKDVPQKYYLPRLGKIHLGFKDPAKNNAPTRTEYFVCPPEVQSVFGNKPKQLEIMIPVSNDELWRSEYYRYYTRSRGLICKGDGEMAIRMIDTANGDLPTDKSKDFAMVDIKCAGRECPFYKNKSCKRVMNLQFMIPKVPGLGIWQIDTTSNTSINNIKGGELFVRALYGRINMVPLLLELKPVDKTNLSDGKKHTVYAMNLNTAGTAIDLALSARQQAEVFEIELTGNGHEDDDDDNDPALAPETPEQVRRNVDELWPSDTKSDEPPITQESEPLSKSNHLPRDPKTIHNFGELYQAICQDWPDNYKTKADILKDLGVSRQEDLSETPEMLYLQIAEVRK